MHFKRLRRRCPWKGIAAGLIGGLAGSYAMTLFQQGWSAASEKLNKNNNSGQQSQSQSDGEDSEDATVKAADKIYRAVFGTPLSKEKKKAAGPLVHYVFGTAMGGLYGVAAEYDRRVTYGAGVPFGAALFATADEVAVPALGLSKDPTESPLSQHAYALASHAVYGATAEAVRRLTRKALRKL
jgi:putative membrane protein